MDDKKKVIIAVVLFVFLGLMVFTFANPNDEEDRLDGNGIEQQEQIGDEENNKPTTGDDENTGILEEGNQTGNQGNVTPVVLTDNSYDLALQAVINAEEKIDEESYNAAEDLVNKVTNNDQKEQLEERLEEVKDGIDAKALVEELTKQVETSENKDNMDDARDFRTDEEIVEKVNALSNEELKEELQEQLLTLALLLDDTTAPVVKDENGDEITDEKVLGEATSLIIEDDNKIVMTIKEENSNSSNEITEGYAVGEGTYTLTITDEAFNETVVTFTIDLSDPEINVENKSHSTEKIDVVITDRTFKYVEIYNRDANTKVLSTNSEFTLEDEATYRITAYDETGRSTVIWTAIDNTEPTISGVDNAKHYNEKEIEVTVEDKFLMNLKVTGPDGEEVFTRDNFNVGKNKEDYSFVYTATKEGVYTVVATDKAGKEITKTFTIDRTKPVITGVEDGGYYQSVIPGVIEENFKNATLKLNGEPIKSYEVGDTLTKEGTYTLVVTDKAMNKSNAGKVVTFVVDNSIKIPTITYSTIEPTNGGVTVTLTSDEEVEVLNAGTWNPASGFNTVFKKVYFANGTQTVTVRDKAGNTTTVDVVITNIDKEAPKPVSTKYSTSEPTNGSVTVTITLSEELKPVEGWTLSEDKKSISREFTKNVNGNVIVSDLAGNTITKYYSIQNIDKEAPKPVSTKYSTSEPTNGSVTVTITLSEELKPVEGWTLSEDKKSISREFTENVNGNVIVSDLAGNTITKYYSIQNIDKVAPVPTVTMSNNNGNWSTNQDVIATLKTNEAINAPEGWTVVTEGYEFTKVYSANEKVSFTITDLAGNEAPVSFEVKRIDKDNPVLTIINPDKYQIEVGSQYVDKGYSAWDAVDKDVTHLIKITYQFQEKGTSNWDSVDSLDTNKLGTYKVTYTAYDKAGNTAKGTRVVQIVDTILPTFEVHSLVGKDPYYSQISFKLHDNHLVDKFTINGVEYDRTDAAWSDANYGNIKNSLKNGENVFVLYDVYGNTTEYKFNLDLVAPTITVKNANVNTLVLTNPSFAISDNNLIDKFTVNGEEFDRGDAKYSDANYDNIKWALKNGENEFVLYDVAGNSTKFTFVLATNGAENVTVNVTEDVKLVNKPFYNEVGLTKPLTINGNGKTITQEVTSVDEFNWIGGTRTTKGVLFSTDNGAQITVKNINFAGTIQTISLGQYKSSTYNNFNTVFENVNVIGLEVVSFSANVSPAVVVYGTATLNNTNIYGTKLSDLDTDPMWPAYDLALVNYTTTKINGGKIGSIVTWNQLSLTLNDTEVDTILTSTSNKDGIIVNDGTVVNLIDVEDVGDAHRKVPNAPIITINSGATVKTLDLRGAKDYSKVTINDGATVNKIITDSEEMTLEEWKAKY